MQGDLLMRTDEICSILNQFFPHYLKHDYSYFIVLTQSCDLVHRKDGVKAPYISIAAVRPFDTVLQRELEKQQSEELEKFGGFCSTAKRSAMYSFVEKVYNNNHSEYFYLHKDQSLGLSEPFCAFLRLSIALRTSEHYETLLRAKYLELTEEFRAKLGHTVGDLYSRVGTKDWVPDKMTDNEFKKFINETLDRKAIWIDKVVLTEAKKEITGKELNLQKMSPSELKAIVSKIRIPTKSDRLKELSVRIVQTLQKSKALVEDADLEKIAKKIAADQLFASSIK